MRQNAWWPLAALLVVATASAQTPSTAPRAQISVSFPGDSPPAAPSATLNPDKTALLRAENLVPFDYRKAEVRWIDQRWQLVADGVWLKDFGQREADARNALRLIQALRLTQRGTVGTPLPVMEYWLADGQAPQGFSTGARVQTLDLATLRVDQLQAQWCVRDNHRILFNFGPHRDDAEQALALIRRYGFTHIGTIGQPRPAMTYFLNGDGGLSHNRLVTPQDLKSGTVATVKASEPSSAHPGQTPQPNALTPEPLPAGRQPVTDAARASAPSFPERLPFDYRQVQVRRDQGDWKVVYGSHVFANFGPDQMTAQQVLNLFQYYRFTEQLVIGRPVPAFSFFLVGGQAPRGLKFGIPAESFSPEAVLVRQVGTQWTVCAGDQVLMSFGDNQEDAKQLAQAIQRYRFDHLVRLGNGPGRSMTFLVRAR
jgi:hypothetical protein